MGGGGGGGGGGSQPLADGTYLVGDFAMTKEQYEDRMAEGKIHEAELIHFLHTH